MEGKLIKTIKNVTESTIHLKSIGRKLNTGEFYEIEQPQLHVHLISTELINHIVSGNIQVGNGTVFFTDPYEGLLYFKTMFDDFAYILDSEDNMQEFTPDIVEDANTGKKSTSLFMNMLTIMRDLYNATDNPIYDSAFTPILGSIGWAEDHANRIENCELIHSKNGWHNQQVIKSTYEKPRDLLIYYGWLNSFNSAAHGWDNEKVAQEMAKYGVLVFGDGVQDPSHGDYSNTTTIIARIKALNPTALIFGYVTVNQTLQNFKDKADDWDDLGVHGIFMDEAGYDYGKTRSEFNDRVDYVHGLTDAKLCFANSWNMDHIIGTANDTSYPNTTYNSSLDESNLTENDWYLLESFAVNTTDYTDNYAPKADWSSRGSKAITHRAEYGINLAAANIIADGDSEEAALFKFAFVSGLMFSLEASGSSDTSYGSSSSKTKFVSRENVTGMLCWSLNPSVQVDNNDADVYHRYVEFGKLSVDFSSGAESSSITKY